MESNLVDVVFEQPESQLEEGEQSDRDSEENHSGVYRSPSTRGKASDVIRLGTERKVDENGRDFVNYGEDTMASSNLKSVPNHSGSNLSVTSESPLYGNSQNGDSSSNTSGEPGEKFCDVPPNSRFNPATPNDQNSSFADDASVVNTESLQRQGSGEQFSDSAAVYRPDTGTLYLPLVASEENNNREMAKKSPGASSLTKQGSRKKKRSGSWYNMLSPNYKQKNEDLHKFFKNLPESERLLVDYTCALVKDILIQGRLYVSQNFVCFHSRFLKMQTAIQISYKDIVSLTKEKTVKVIPNAIQFVTTTRKLTFTSFTTRDKAYQQILSLWQVRDKTMTSQDVWAMIRGQYGNSLGCSSDEDYPKPADDEVDAKEDDAASALRSPKTKPPKASRSSKNRPSLSDAQGRITLPPIADHSTGDDKSSHRSSVDDLALTEGDDDSLPQDGDILPDDEYEDPGPAEFAVDPCKRVVLQKTFNVSAEHMFDTIYGDTCPFWRNHLSKEASEIMIGKWGGPDPANNGNRIRQLDYVLSISNPLGPKTSSVTENQVLYKESSAGWSYTVDCIAEMRGVPYSDYFVTIMRYCIRRLTRDTCELTISTDIKFVKTPWGLVKSFIEKNCYSGVEENFKKFFPELEEYFEQEKSRRKASTSPISSSSKTASNLRRRSTTGSPGKKQVAPDDVTTQQEPKVTTSLPNGILPRPKSLGSPDHVIAAPSTTPLALPSQTDANNNTNSGSGDIPLIRSGGKIQLETSVRQRWRTGAIALIFVILIYSNFSMYQRLLTLEQVHVTSKSSEWNDIKSANTFFQMPGGGSDTSENQEKFLKLLDQRLARMEDLVARHVTSNDNRWRHLVDSWSSINTRINLLLNKVETSPES